MDKGGSDKREDLAVREATSTTIARETFADEGLRRQRAERGLIQPFEKVAAAGAVEPHRPRVEIREELGDPGVEGGQGEEGLVPEAGEDPPLRDLHGDFDLRLVPGLRRPRREDDRAVVAPVTPPMNWKARWWLATQSGI